jgi:hypothetical protein
VRRHGDLAEWFERFPARRQMFGRRGADMAAHGVRGRMSIRAGRGIMRA